MSEEREVPVDYDGPDLKKFIHVLITFVVVDFVLERIILGTNVANLIIGICRFSAGPLFDSLMAYWKMFKGETQAQVPPTSTTE